MIDAGLVCVPFVCVARFVCGSFVSSTVRLPPLISSTSIYFQTNLNSTIGFMTARPTWWFITISSALGFWPTCVLAFSRRNGNNYSPNQPRTPGIHIYIYTWLDLEEQNKMTSKRRSNKMSRRLSYHGYVLPL